MAVAAVGRAQFGTDSSLVRPSQGNVSGAALALHAQTLFEVICMQSKVGKHLKYDEL